MAKICPHCNTHDNPPEYEFCKYDGYELMEEGSATASTLPRVPTPPGGGSTGVPNTGPSTSVPPRSGSATAYAGKAKLIVMRSGQPGNEFAISGEQAVIGRWDSEVQSFPEVDLTDDDPGCFISRHHARVYLSNGRYYIEDLGSSNKTILNKANKLNPHASAELKNGDEIIVGKTFLKFVIEY